MGSHQGFDPRDVLHLVLALRMLCERISVASSVKDLGTATISQEKWCSTNTRTLKSLTSVSVPSVLLHHIDNFDLLQQSGGSVF